MKTFCALATLAAATAVENTAPVISLSLDSTSLSECNATLADRNTAPAEKSKCIKYSDHVTAHGVTSFDDAAGTSGAVAANTYSSTHPNSFAAKGLVGATEAEFPEPTASAYDHHDASNVEIIKTYTYFVVSRPACNTFDKTSGDDSETLAAPTGQLANNALSAGTEENNGNFKTSEEQCVMKQSAANVDLVKDADGEGDDANGVDLVDSKQATFTTAMRARRGEFIIKYNAEDRAGNQASQLVFAMILVDDECPCLTLGDWTTEAGLPEVEAMDTCAAVDFKSGGKTGTNTEDPDEYTVCDTLDRSKIVLDDKLISWKDNYDGFSPTLANADYVVRSHGLSYTITHPGTTPYVVSSKHSASDTKQAVYDMSDEKAVSNEETGTAITTTISYTTKDYANIFGFGYADNQCVDGVQANKDAADATQTHCDTMPATSWTIKDSLPPRVFANPNLHANDAGIKNGVRCGAAISNVPTTFTDGPRDACHSWNIRRRWCAGDANAVPECVGWSATQIFQSDPVQYGTQIACDYEDSEAVHECGTEYEEPGYVCIDMRDSFSTTSEGPYKLAITGVNDGSADKCKEYHVDTTIDCMHEGIIYSQGANITSTSESRDGFTLSGKQNDPDAYPLYGKDGVCSTTFTAEYKCTDKVGQSSAPTVRTITITDTRAPTLEIATAGMNLVNAKVGEGYTLSYECVGQNSGCAASNNDFTDKTNMGVGYGNTLGRTDILHFGAIDHYAAYINGADSSETDWHTDHDSANSKKGMNSHYHNSQHESFNQTITDGPHADTSDPAYNYGGKTWKIDAGVVTLRNHTTMVVTDAGIQRGVQDSYVIQHSSGFDADEAVITNLVKAHKGFACYDTCDGDLTHAMTYNTGGTAAPTPVNGVTMTWHKHTGEDDNCDGDALDDGFNTLVPGTYVLKYVCTDQCNNNDTKCRTILNEDHTKPVITVLEADEQTYEATRNDNYVDAGATCSDEVDGNISQDVEVSGDVVNLARVGVYTIKYNCQDSASNEADEATRTVTVQDTSCPSCIVSDGHTSGLDHITSIEASFPYGDAGAVAQDTLQGSFGICSVWGNEGAHDVGTAYGMKASYKNIVNVERTGTYVITYRVKDSNGNWNDMTTANDGCTGGQTGGENKRTVVIIDTLRPVIELKYRAGPQTVDSNGATTTPYQVIHRSNAEFTQGVSGEPRGDGDVLDRADDLVHTGAFHNEDANPAAGGALMAEESATTAVNGWVIGAVASAVSGLALLGYSLRKSAAPVATSVPV